MKSEQLTLMDAVLSFSRRKKVSRAVGTLGEIEKLVDWAVLAEIVAVLDRTKSGRGGRPPIDFEIKLKMLFLQYTFNLSDEELEDQLSPRRELGRTRPAEFPAVRGSRIRSGDTGLYDGVAFQGRTGESGADGLDICEHRGADREERADIKERNDRGRDDHSECEPPIEQPEAREAGAEAEPRSARSAEPPDRHGSGEHGQGRQTVFRIQRAHRD